MNSEQREALLRAAELAATKAYAPYSNFRVGAAAMGVSGSVFEGANIENASYGLTLCAERVALAAAKMSGEREIIGIAVACVDSPAGCSLESKMPCGACRQWIQELAPRAEILILGETAHFTVQDLLPRAFRLDPVGLK